MADFYTYKSDLRPWGTGTPIAYKVDPNLALPFNQGEMAAWDPGATTLVRWIRDGSGGIKFVGVTRDSQSGIQKLGNQPALKSFLNPLSVFTTGIHELLGVAGVTYTHGGAVYMSGTDTTAVTTSQNVTSVQVGTVHLPDGSSKVGAVRVPVLIDEYTIAQA